MNRARRSPSDNQKLPLSLSSSVALALSFCAIGCAPTHFVHERYAELRPQRIAVPPVNNLTTAPLREVTVGRALQEVLGAKRYNMLTLLRKGLRNALTKTGYEVGGGDRLGERDYRKPVDASEAPPINAVLYVGIQSWRRVHGISEGFIMKFELALHAVPSGERLFEGTFKCSYRVGSRGRTESVEGAVARAAHRAIGALP